MGGGYYLCREQGGKGLGRVCHRRVLPHNLRLSVSATFRTEVLHLEALNMATWNVEEDLHGLVHHSDRGSNYVSLAYTDLIAKLGGTPSVGSKDGSYNNILAGSRFALFKTELIKKNRPERRVKQVQPATLKWVWCLNNHRLHSELDYRIPTEVEAEYSAGKSPMSPAAAHETPQEPNPGRFTHDLRAPEDYCDRGSS